MRATCATKLYEQTGDIYLVQQQLGHKNIENTKRYAKVSETKMREAANILDTAY
jgi:site-specific recombinase XerD